FKRPSSDECRLLTSFEELHSSFVSFRCFARSKRSQVAALPSFRVLLSRIEPIPPGFGFADHDSPQPPLDADCEWSRFHTVGANGRPRAPAVSGVEGSGQAQLNLRAL